MGDGVDRRQGPNVPPCPFAAGLARGAERRSTLGAWVWFWQQAGSFWEYVLAIFQGLFWPAWMVYAVFEALAR